MDLVVANATIELCLDNGRQEECEQFLATAEDIQMPVVGGELGVSFSVQIEDGIRYSSKLYLGYETGQEIHSLNSVPIGMYSICT